MMKSASLAVLLWMVGTTSALSPVQRCRDEDQSCMQWADAGFCTDGRYTSYMARSCQMSCGMCSGHEKNSYGLSSAYSYLHWASLKTAENSANKKEIMDVEKLLQLVSYSAEPLGK